MADIGGITGVSYIGAPKDHTAMYITTKVQRLLSGLENAAGCLIFAETGMDVPEALLLRHRFSFSDNPQLAYTEFAQQLADQQDAQDDARVYTLAPGGYYLGENVTIGQGAVIQPMALIGHGVTIGARARIGAGAKIFRAVIGDDFIAGPGCTIGTWGFTMARDEAGDNIRIPTLGMVRIGNRVEIGALTNVCCGSGADTVLEDCAKVDALVHLGHDVHLRKNTEIAAGVILGGYSDIGADTFAGINAAVRNRAVVGPHTTIGMGAVVTKALPEQSTVVGNPAKPMKNV